MRLEVLPVGGNLRFTISDWPPAYLEVLESLFYTREGDCFYKEFAGDTPYIMETSVNFVRDADAMFAGLAGLKPVCWSNAIHDVEGRLGGAGIEWWLTGSCAAAIRGAAIKPHDVDIMLEAPDRERVAGLFADCILEPIRDTTGWVTSHFGVAYLGARVDLAFSPQPMLDRAGPSDSGPWARDHLEQAEWEGLTIRVPPLVVQAETNRRRGRIDRWQAIRDVLEGKNRPGTV